MIKKYFFRICGILFLLGLIFLISVRVLTWYNSRPYIPEYVTEIKGTDIDATEDTIVYSSKYFGTPGQNAARKSDFPFLKFGNASSSGFGIIERSLEPKMYISEEVINGGPISKSSQRLTIFDKNGIISEIPVPVEIQAYNRNIQYQWFGDKVLLWSTHLHGDKIFIVDVSKNESPSFQTIYVPTDIKSVTYYGPSIAVNPFNPDLFAITYCLRYSHGFVIEPSCGRQGVAVYNSKNNIFKAIFAKDMVGSNIRIGWNADNLYLKEGKIDFSVSAAESSHASMPDTVSRAEDILYVFPIGKI